MAAFSTMALLGLAGAGGLLAGKKLGQKPGGATPQGPILGPKPTTAAASTTTQPPTPLPSASETGSTNTATAMQAAARRRRKAQGAQPGARRQGQPALTALLNPTSLLGAP